MSPLLVIKVVIAETSGAHYGEQILKFIQSHNYHMTSISFGFLKYSTDCVFAFLMSHDG